MRALVLFAVILAGCSPSPWVTIPRYAEIYYRDSVVSGYRYTQTWAIIRRDDVYGIWRMTPGDTLYGMKPDTAWYEVRLLNCWWLITDETGKRLILEEE